MSIFTDINKWLVEDGGGAALNSALGLAGGVYSIDQGLAAAERMENLGNYLNDWAVTQGNTLADNSAFKGYGITSGLGTTTGGVNPTTGAFDFTFGVGQDAQFMNQGDAQRTAGGLAMNQLGPALRKALASYGNYDTGSAVSALMNRSLADPSLREQELYDRMMAIQNPELDRAQALQQAQEYAMGRGGVRGSMYGGTAEDAAMARARAQASNEAAMNAIDLAQKERGMFADMANAYGQLGNQRAQGIAQVGQTYGDFGLNRYGLGTKMEELSYLPIESQLAILNQAMGGVEMGQTGQLTGQGFLSQYGLGGMGNNVNAQKVANETRADLMSALLANLGGATGSDGSSTSGLGGFLSGVVGGIDDIYTKYIKPSI